jgi:hypothetical protein
MLIFGPQAVGKMTVGQELTKITSLKLFHNHMSIDLLVPLFGFTQEMWGLCHLFREQVFKTYAKSDQNGLIFTTVWAFNNPEDWIHVGRMCQIFRSAGAEIYFVELEADVAVRLKRNRTENRLAAKPLKRDIASSEQDLLSSMEKYRLNSKPGEITERNYLRIHNDGISAEEIARMIQRKFCL